jgi:hypothetical protein
MLIFPRKELFLYVINSSSILEANKNENLMNGEMVNLKFLYGKYRFSFDILAATSLLALSPLFVVTYKYSDNIF